MRLLLPLEQRYYRDSDGRIFSADPANYVYLQKFLKVFTEVVVLARVRESRSSFSPVQRADGPQVGFAALPDFRTPFSLLAHSRQFRSVTRGAVESCDAFLLRLPGVVSELARRGILEKGARYGVQVVGDPQEVFHSMATSSPLRPFYRSFFTRQVERACREEANAVAYVSRCTLPERYPAGAGVPTFLLSNVDLHGAIISAEALDRRSVRLIESKAPLHIGVVAYLDAAYKGVDVLLQALSICKASLDFRCTVLGDGALKERLIALSRDLGLADRLTFAGHRNAGAEIFEFLDTVDLYVQPSRTEGLPRALIEAMARGCAAIGTNVGGIPQLLSKSELVPPNDAPALAAKILEVASDRGRMGQMARHNVESARAYDGPRLDGIRLAFLQSIRNGSSQKVKGVACSCAE